MIPPAPTHRTSRNRHGRRPARSALSGSFIADPFSRVNRFIRDAQTVVHYLQTEIPEIREVVFGFRTVPDENPPSNTEMPNLYRINREQKSIIFYRVPIQRAKGLHVDDELHRRMFIEHVVYRAVCEYLGESPWSLLPGRFDHY